jgi:hypothetical protein
VTTSIAGLLSERARDQPLVGAGVGGVERVGVGGVEQRDAGLDRGGDHGDAALGVARGVGR